MKISPRRRAREFAVQALYQVAIGEIGVNEVAKNIREASDFGRADEALFTAIFFGAQSNKAEYMAIIRPLLDRDEKDISPIERAVLLMACHELKAMPETPYPVIINEAIEIAKTFGGADRPTAPKRSQAQLKRQRNKCLSENLPTCFQTGIVQRIETY